MIDLKAELSAWYDRKGVYPAEGRRMLSALTGISPRTLEGVEQHGRFRYPAALRFILQRS